MDLDLIDYLIAKQQSLHLNDAQFARFLGNVDLSTWLRYKRRERTGDQMRLMQLAAARWPKERAAIFESALKARVRGGQPQPA